MLCRSRFFGSTLPLLIAGLLCREAANAEPTPAPSGSPTTDVAENPTETLPDPGAPAAPASSEPVAAPLPSAPAAQAPNASAPAQAPTSPAPGAKPQPARARLPDCECRPRRWRPDVTRRRYIEASFGTAELFTNQSVTDPGGIVRQRVIPITALNLLGEWLVHPRVAVMVQFLLPLEPESKLVDGELTLEYVPPALSGGVRLSAFNAEVVDDILLEGQLLGLVGTTIADLDGNDVYPTAGWRVHLRERRGFTLYLGGSFAFRQNTTGFLYGVGHRF